ncbi:N-methyl-L-tryptophan oxidase [Streptomyces polygonati]
MKMIGEGSGRRRYDVVVIGLGIMGSAALAHLARRGIGVLGIDAHGPAHVLGSSHGQTRIFRRAYWEGEVFLPLLERAHEGWQELHAANATGDPVILSEGGLFVGSADSRLVRGARDTASTHGVAHEYLDADDIRRRFPAFHVTDDEVAILEPGAMMLSAQTARFGYLSQAVRDGAHLTYGRRALSLTSNETSVTIRGDDWQLSCGSVVVAAGGWARQLLPRDLSDQITPMRIPVFELPVAAGHESSHQPGRFPVFLFEDTGGALVYGLPPWRAGGGVRVGFHNRQLSQTDMDAPRQPPTNAELHDVWKSVSRLLPGLRPEGSGTACVYTMTADESFFVARSSEFRNVAYVSACSGHGFKFAPALGEAMAELVVDGRTSVDISAFAARTVA